MDKELQAMSRIFKILGSLDEASRGRVWKWIDEKLGELPFDAVACQGEETSDGPQG